MAAYRPDASQALVRSAGAAIVAGALIAVLVYGKDVLIPIALAVLLSFVLTPLVNLLTNRSVPRGLAVGIVVVTTVILVVGVGYALARQVIDLGNDLPRYESTLRQKLKTFRTGAAQSSAIDKATAALRGLGQELDQPNAAQVGTNEPPSVGAQRPIPVEVRQPPDRPLDVYQRILTAMMAPMTTTAIVLIMVIFILLQQNDIRDRIIRLAGSKDIQLTTAAMNDAASRLSRLFLVQAALNFSFGFVIAAGLWIIGVPSPVLWGVFAGLMRFVPYIGSILSAIFPLLLAASVDQSWSMVVETALLYVLLEPLVGNLIEPWLQGQSTGLSPLAIVVSTVLWATLWGPIGLLIATPITMCMVVLGRHIEGLKFLDVILGDEPALAPEEIFYHRLMSRSAAEVADQAERYLASRGLVDYFDDVALPGLKLASIDAERDVINVAEMQTLRENVGLLIDELGDTSLNPEEVLPSKEDDTKRDKGDNAIRTPLLAPPETDCLRVEFRATKPAIMCLGVNTPVDAAAADLLGELLRRHGLKCHVDGLSRLSDVKQLKISGEIKLIWIISTETSFSRARTKYIVKNIKRLVPNTLIFGAFMTSMTGNNENNNSGLNGSSSTFYDAVARSLKLATETTDQGGIDDGVKPCTTDRLLNFSPADKCLRI